MQYNQQTTVVDSLAVVGDIELITGYGYVTYQHHNGHYSPSRMYVHHVSV